MFREIETVFLGRTGRILTACDGTEALEIARRERPDLVLTDLSMREMDGDELCRQIRHDPDLRHVPVIVVTSGNSAEEHERAVRAGADGVISKPLCRVTLLQVVQRFLRLTVRSFERVTLETEVRLSRERTATSGRWSRNVSRGGMFVEADIALEPDSEFEVEFTVPDTSIVVQPTARVVWRRPADHERAARHGPAVPEARPRRRAVARAVRLRAQRGGRGPRARESDRARGPLDSARFEQLVLVVDVRVHVEVVRAALHDREHLVALLHDRRAARAHAIAVAW